MANVTQTPATPWLRVREAAAYAKRSESGILNALRAGELSGSQVTARGTWTVHIEDLDAWLRGERADVKAPAVSRSRRSA